MELEANRLAVAAALRALERALEQLAQALAHAPLELAVEGTRARAAGLRRVVEAFRAIDYGMEDAPGESVVCLGVVGAPREVVRLATAVNDAKANLATVCAPLTRLRRRVPVRGEAGPTRAIPLVRVILRSLQRSDLNLKAAYRKLPILAAHPASIGYTRARTRLVYRKSVDEIGDLLRDRDGPTASADRARLAGLSPRERWLALVTERYDNVRANVVYDGLDKRGRGRVQIPAELPVLFALGKGRSFPEVRFPTHDGADDDAPPRARAGRLESEPFLATLPVYRYLD